MTISNSRCRRACRQYCQKGEHIIWQGAPIARELALQAFHVRKVSAYFGVLISARFVLAIGDGLPWPQALASFGLYAAAAVCALGILIGIAHLVERSTIYTLTTSRLILRYGIALPVTLNIPLSRIVTAKLACSDGDIGDIALEPAEDTRLAYLLLWPHARPWHISHPQPVLRCVRDASHVAAVLGDALKASAGNERPTIIRVQPPAPSALSNARPILAAAE